MTATYAFVTEHDDDITPTSPRNLMAFVQRGTQVTAFSPDAETEAWWNHDIAVMAEVYHRPHLLQDIFGSGWTYRHIEIGNLDEKAVAMIDARIPGFAHRVQAWT